MFLSYKSYVNMNQERQLVPNSAG